MMNERSECFVDIFRLSERSGCLSEELDLLKNEFGELENCLEELTTYWKGTASEAYIFEMTRSLEGLNEFIQSIDKVSEDFRFALQTYMKCEERVSEIISAVDCEVY